jgi:hypothetical protein
MLPRFSTKNLDRAEKFLDMILQPANCSGVEYVTIWMGAGGGFAGCVPN